MAIGGHEGIKNEYLEDQIFGEKIKEQNLNLRLLSAPELLKQKFYKSFHELKEGWVKIFYFNIRKDGKILKHFSMPLFLFLTFIFPWIVFVFSLLIQGKSNITLAILLISGFQLLAFFRAHTMMRNFFLMKRCLPILTSLGGGVLILIWCEAMYRVIFKKGATWKNVVYRDSDLDSV